MAIGRISGPLLKANLLRDGVNLAFENDLLFLDVVNGRVGIKTANPTHDLTVNGSTRTTNLEVTNQADIAQFTIVGNTISSSNSTINLEPTGSNPVVYQGKIVTGDLEITGSSISITQLDVDLEFNTLGTGKVNVNGNMLVNGDVHVTGNISADGDIQIGDEDTDSITFNADITSNLIPDVTDTYNLGTTDKRWNTVFANNIVTDNVVSDNILIDGIDLALPQGNILYVATTGNDTSAGNHEHAPHLTVKHALSQATSGTTVFVYPGTYTEEFPLTVPVGVTLKGSGIRSVTIQPTVETNANDAILLNGETTVEDLTVANFFYNLADNTGYGFRFANNITVSSRSPYIRNVSVIARGSVTSPTDSFGFDSNDAGKGALVDGSVATAASKEASMLFHSVTFFTPNQECIVATNGVRIEWLNSFSYFADKGIYAISGTSGFAGAGKTRLRINTQLGTWAVGDTLSYYDTDGTTVLASGIIHSVDGDFVNLTGRQIGFVTTAIQDLRTSSGGTAQLINFADYSDFGAEIRSIGSACVYGNFGVVGDGDGVTVYLISQNFAYIGAGKSSSNDPYDRIAANEAVELNRARVYYTSVDNEGNFRVGDAFFVNQKTGDVLFGGENLAITAAQGVVFTDGTNSTTITSTDINTGNIQISGNTVESVTGPLNISAANNQINLQNNTFVTGNLDVTGNVTIGGNIQIGDETTDSINFVGGIDSDLIPATDSTYDLGAVDKRWDNVYVSQVNIGSVVINNDTISTTGLDTDLILNPTGTGKVLIPSSNLQVNENVVVDGNLTVTLGSTLLKDVTVVGDFDVTGNILQTGNFTTTGTVEVTGNITATGTLNLPVISLSGNTISTTVADTDLELQANGAGNVVIETLEFDDNIIRATSINSDIVLTPQGTGSVVVDSDQSIIIPVGTTAQRPVVGTEVVGMIRYNTNLNQYEGWTGNYWLTLGGVKDADGDTYILAESTPGADEDTLYFYAGGNLTVTIDQFKLFAEKIETANLAFENNTITTINANADIILSTTGTGGVKVGNFIVKGNTITNTVTGAVTEFLQTGTGYVKIAGTNGVVIPAGDTANDRPLVPEIGMMRFNTADQLVEVYNGVTWTSVAGTSGGITLAEAEELGVVSALLFG